MLKKKLDESQEFFKGTKLKTVIKGRELDSKEFTTLKNLIFEIEEKIRENISEVENLSAQLENLNKEKEKIKQETGELNVFCNKLQIEIDEYIRQKQWKNAYEVSQKLIQIEPSENRIIKNILICIELGENQQAFFLADELYTDNPTSEEVQITYVKTLVANNKKTEAITLINSLLQKASSKMKSELYYQKSRLESSDDKKLSDLRSSLTANPRNEEALFALYELYFKKNDYRKAQYYLKQVIALNPSNQELLDLNSNLENYLY